MFNNKTAKKFGVIIAITILLGMIMFQLIAWCPYGYDGWGGSMSKGRRFDNPPPEPVPPKTRGDGKDATPAPTPTTPEPAPKPAPAPAPTPAPTPPPEPAPGKMIPPPASPPAPAPAPAPSPATPAPATPPPSTEQPPANSTPARPAAPSRPPAGTGLEPLIFNPIISVPMWENWWTRNRLNYLPFKKPIDWNDKKNNNTDGTISVETNSLSKKALDVLIQALKEEENPIVRANIVLALGKYKNRTALGSLKEAFKNDESFDVRNVSGLALGIMGDEAAVGDLKEILLDEGDQKSQMISRAYAALSLGYIKTDASISALKEVLKPERKAHKEIQCSAVISLGNLEDKSLIPFLGSILNDSARDEHVRAYAALALGRIKDSSALPELRKALSSNESSIRSSIVIAMGMIASPQAKNDLVNIIAKDKSTEVQAFAAISLAQLGDSSVCSTLATLSKKADFNIEGMGVLALGILGDKSSVPELQKIVIKKTRPLSRGAAILALAFLKDKTIVPELIKIVKNEASSDKVTWAYAVLALGMLGDQKAIPALEDAFKLAQERIDLATSGYNNLTVALAMLGKQKEVLETLYSQLNDKMLHPQIRMRAICGIGYLGDKTSIEPLINFYKQEKNDDLRGYAVLALGFVLDKDKINPLYKITADNDFKITLLIIDHIFFSKPE
jgi:HEAT repeat protein